MKKTNKNDSKYFNTSLLMNQALLSILEKKDFDFITIKEICHKAGVNRSTFYLHYENLNDLLEETINMLNAKFTDTFKTDNLLNFDENMVFVTEKYLLPYLSYVKENRKIFLLIHEKPEIFKNEQAFNKIASTIIYTALSRHNVPEEEKPYVLECYTKGVLAIIFKWIERNCEDDEQLIIKLIKDFTKQR